MARIWKGGCIIRSQAARSDQEGLQVELEASESADAPAVPDDRQQLHATAQIARLAADTGVPVPCLGATLAYIESYRSEFLPANLLQALRDNFGAHTYQRLDHEGVFHSEWNQ